MKSENITSEMIDILRYCHQYVPQSAGCLHPIFFGGDQLTSERARNGQLAVQDADTEAGRLKGFICKSEDWHCRVALLECIFSLLYKENGDADIGTLKQLKVATFRRFSSDIHKDVTAATAFLDLVNDAYITKTAMDHLGMKSTSDFPPPFTKENVSQWSDTEKRDSLYNLSEAIVDTYILRDHQSLMELARDFDQQQQTMKQVQCRHPGCTKTYIYLKCRQNHEQREHNLSLPVSDHDGLLLSTDRDRDRNSSCSPIDHVYEYSTALMKLGLLHRDFHDAIRDADGDRIAMLWKFLMLIFYHHGHTKYSLEALLLTARLEATLTIQQAEKLKWNRSVNTRGGTGRNIPLDLALEHLNNSTKRDIKNLGANVTPEAARRCIVRQPTMLTRSWLHLTTLLK